MNTLPNGFVLKLRESCMLGMRGALVSTHKTEAEAEAEAKAKSLGCSLSVFEILDIYNDRVLTARTA